MPCREDLQRDSFDRLYDTDLVYRSDCWQLCGDAHCCNFSRYKSQFRLLGRTPFQEMPLLPGEYEYLESKGWLAQFGDVDHQTVEYALPDYTLRAESIISRRQNCACDHDTRPVVCRLYPLLPVFAVDGRCLGWEPLGIYEELEQVAGLQQACKLEALPFGELQKFLAITSELARHPIWLFYLEAYRLTKQHVRERLTAAHDGTTSIFRLFETMYVRKTLIDDAALRWQLESLLSDFREYYGSDCLETADVAPHTVDD